MKLVLSSTRLSWDVPLNHGSEPELDKNKSLQEVREKILKRDSYKCRFCGFQSKKWQELHHLDDDHKNNSEQNLVTICPLCHQSFHLGKTGMSNGGVLIWLPEMQQEELNHLMRCIFVAKKDEKSRDLAHQLEKTLESRSMYLISYLGPQASDPALLGQLFLKMKKEEYEKRESFTKYFRLLPRSARFENQINYWREECFRDLPVNSWEKLIPKSLKDS